MSSVQYRFSTCGQPEAPILMMTQLMCMGPAEPLSVPQGQCSACVVQREGRGRGGDGLFKQPTENRQHCFSAGRGKVNWSDRCARSCSGLQLKKKKKKKKHFTLLQKQEKKRKEKKRGVRAERFKTSTEGYYQRACDRREAVYR